MLTLSLLRHAKSSWRDPNLADFDRPLAERGSRAAPLMGKAMSEHGLVPDLVMCSPARRTRETLDLVLAQLGANTHVELEDALYHASPQTMLELAARVPPEVRHMLLVGHNPPLHDFALKLTGAGEKDLRETLAAKYPTAGLAVLTFPIAGWSEIRPGSGILTLFLTPKALQRESA
jgi:phosphohistidine phosphatase